MLEVLVDLIEVETKLRTYLLAEGLLQVPDLTGVFDEEAGAGDHIALLDAGVLLIREEGRVGTGKGLLLAVSSGYFHCIFLVSVGNEIVDVEGFSLVGTTDLFEARGDGESWE